jgi:PhnB protein
MMKLNPYLMFSGNCREALTFYKDCLDGDIASIQTFADSPLDVPEEHGNRIFNSEFRAGDLFFMASDDLPNSQVTKGSNFALFVAFSEMEEQERVFGRLAEGGKVLFPLTNGFGMLADKFGIQWMVALNR